MLVNLELCQECAAKLREVLRTQGEQKMAEAVGPTLQACPTCRRQLPQREGTMVTRLKQLS